MPKRPHTALITSRYDAKALATIVKFYHSQGVHIQNKSTLPTQIIYDFEKILIMNNMVEPFTDTQVAKQYLETLGMDVVAKSVTLAYLKQLEVESIVSERPNIDPQDHTNQSVRDAIHNTLKSEGA